ncbi:MAG: AMP-binding protein [Solirubrobacterales bacterium]|nr:AMP-binding protein [Solirubrobacterales bacterium]
MPELIGDAVRRHAAERPDATAVIEVSERGDRAWTWAELQQAIPVLDIERGDTVAYQLPNRLEFVALTLAIVEAGGTCMPLMPIFRERDLEFMLQAARPKALFVPAEPFRGHDHVAMARGFDVPVVPVDTFSAGSASKADTRATHDQAVQLLFTSGTSGEPKGVLHRHDVLMRAAAKHARHFGLDHSDVIFSPAPLAHQTGFLYGMWLALSIGATLVVQEVWEGQRGFDAMERHQVSFVQVATPFLADLVAINKPLPALKTFVATGATVPRELARQARDVLGAKVVGGFGTTETCMAAVGDRWDTDGRAMEGVRLRVRDEFEIQTDTPMIGYLNRPDLTAAAFTDDGWYRTGDLATLEDGELRITGRVKDVINRGGEKVPVAEVEQLMYELEGVREVAIVAMPDPRLGERACAYVVGDVTLEQVRAHLDARRLAKPYWPERVEHLAELPKTPSGKIKKYVLREMVDGL